MTELPFNNEQIVGTCGLCSGPVVLPIAWWGVVPSVPTCRACGAVAKQSYGPVLPMNPPPKIWTTTEITIDPNADSTGGGFRTTFGTECCVR